LHGHFFFETATILTTLTERSPDLPEQRVVIHLRKSTCIFQQLKWRRHAHQSQQGDQAGPDTSE
jgi:hypothetical protein